VAARSLSPTHCAVVSSICSPPLPPLRSFPTRRSSDLAVAAERFREVKRCVARPPGVILVGDRRAEERHDPVAGVLVHGPLEAVHALGEELEEAVEDAVPLLGVELLGEVHRALHIGEEDRHLLALAFEGGAGAQDLLGEVPGRVVARGPRRLCGGRRRGQALPAFLAELGGSAVRVAAGWAAQRARVRLPRLDAHGSARRCRSRKASIASLARRFASPRQSIWKACGAPSRRSSSAGFPAATSASCMRTDWRSASTVAAVPWVKGTGAVARAAGAVGGAGRTR